MKEKKNGKTAHVFLWVGECFPTTFISSFNQWCHGCLVWSVANTQICPSDMTSGRTVSSFLLSVIPLVQMLVSCKTGVSLTLSFYCMFQLLILDVEITIFRFISTPSLELNHVVLLVRLANEGYLILFSLVNRYHRGWLCTSYHADAEPACLTVFTKASC